MCGRIALYTPPSRLARFFEARAAAGLSPDELDRPLTLDPSWNVAPSCDVLMVVDRRSPSEGDGPPLPERLLVPSRWGLVPFWAKDPAVGNRMINARAETVATQPAFRRPFERRRCLVPADGFFEWRPSAAGSRGRRPPAQPWYYRRADGSPLAFAGLWEVWHRPKHPDEVLRTCTIIVTEAGPDVAPVHHRMPVVVEPDDWDEWLGVDDVDPQALQGLLVPAPAGTLVAQPVDPKMNRPEVDDPTVIEAVEEPGGPEQLALLPPPEA